MTATIPDAVTVTCTRCGDGWTATQDPPTFATLDDAIDHLDDAGWSIIDGQLLCPDCALRSVCEGIGHVWGRWTRLVASLTGRWPGGRARHCRVCGAGQFDPPLRRSGTRSSE